jgi:hypothetical protein
MRPLAGATARVAATDGRCNGLLNRTGSNFAVQSNEAKSFNGGWPQRCTRANTACRAARWAAISAVFAPTGAAGQPGQVGQGLPFISLERALQNITAKVALFALPALWRLILFIPFPLGAHRATIDFRRI